MTPASPASNASDRERQESRALLAPYDPSAGLGATQTTTNPTAAETAATPEAPECRPFFESILRGDFRALTADRMMQLPDPGACRKSGKELLDSFVEHYRTHCRSGRAYPSDYRAWTVEDRTAASMCLSVLWMVRSGLLSTRYANANLDLVDDPRTLTALLFGALLTANVPRMGEVADRLAEVAPDSVIGAKGVVTRYAFRMAEEKSGKPLDEPFWRDAESAFERARELAPNDAEVDLFGLMARTRNMDLARLKDELEARQTADGEPSDANTAYLAAYYASKTGKKEDAIPLLAKAARRFPQEADRFRQTAESCRTKPKCEFSLVMNMKIDKLFDLDDVIR
jgi:tetratricopeptide (TPR) repeat protein